MIKIALALILLVLVMAHSIDRERDWIEEETDSTWDHPDYGGHKVKPKGIKKPKPPPRPPKKG